MGERQVWINGRMVPESQGFISFRDLGIIYGEGVFDTARTFGGRLFRLSDHIDRLYDSLAYARIDPGMTKAEMTAATEEVLVANLPVLRPGEDYWVTQRVTAGIRALDGEPQSATGATVIGVVAAEDTAPLLSVTVKVTLTVPLKSAAGTKTSDAACAGVNAALAATGVMPSAR
mgnify:CR=1 FL=1